MDMRDLCERTVSLCARILEATDHVCTADVDRLRDDAVNTMGVCLDYMSEPLWSRYKESRNE